MIVSMYRVSDCSGVKFDVNGSCICFVRSFLEMFLSVVDMVNVVSFVDCMFWFVVVVFCLENVIVF